MKRRTQWSAALLLSGLLLAGLITISVAVSQEPKPPAVDPAVIPGLPGGGAAPLGLPVGPGGGQPVPGTPPPATGAPSALPLQPNAPGAATGTLAIDPTPGGPPGAGNPNAIDSGISFLNNLSGPAETPRLQVITLKHANPQAVREVIESLMPTTRGLVVTDARTNTLIARVPQKVYEEIVQLVQVLDAAVPAPMGGGMGSTISVPEKPGRVAGGSGFGSVAVPANYSAAQLRHAYEESDRSARALAETIKRGSGGQAVREELRARVSQAFVARQQLLRAELAELQQRLKASQESIELRDRVANEIVERRVKDLLDPNLQWEPASSSLPESGIIGMKGPGPTSMNRPTKEGMFRERDDQLESRPEGSSGMKRFITPTPLDRPIKEEMFREVPDRESRPGNNRPVPDPRIEHPLRFKEPPASGPGSGTTSSLGGSVSDALPASTPDPASNLSESPFELESSLTPERRIVPSQDPIVPSEDPFEMPQRTPDSRDVSSKVVGTLRGRVILDGPFATLAPLYKKGAAPKDTSICGAEEIPDERILVSHSNGLANVFVYLEKAPAGTTPPPVTGPLILDQSGCIFQPRALVVRTEQVIRVFNSDPIAHNVHNYPIKSAVTNMVIAPNDNTGIALKYGQPEKEPVAVGCDIHPWMQAYHLPLNHNFAAVTDADGAFEIADLPAGTHKFKVWHEAGKMLERALEVAIKPGDNDVKIRVSAGHFPKQPPAPGGTPTQKPTGTKALPFTPDGNPLRKEVPAEQFKNKI